MDFACGILIHLRQQAVQLCCIQLHQPFPVCNVVQALEIVPIHQGVDIKARTSRQNWDFAPSVNILCGSFRMSLIQCRRKGLVRVYDVDKVVGDFSLFVF
jgi:hypothetical protein